MKKWMLITVAIAGFTLRAAAITFTENNGQLGDQYDRPRPDILFYGLDDALGFYLKHDGISYQQYRVDSWREQHDAKTGEMHRLIDQQTIYRVDVEWLNSNPNSALELGEALPGYSNYYLAVCPDGVKNIRQFVSVTYHSLYKGIDMKWYVADGHLKYDYLVSAGADVSQIRFRVNGAETIFTDNEGRLIIRTPLGDITEQAPLVTQEGKQLRARWNVRQNEVCFEIENADPALPLTIDPLVRAWGTYYGGSGNDYGQSVATDGSGNAYMTGYASSTNNIATSGSYQNTFAGSSDGFLVKFNSSGVRQWGTYYGGSGDEHGFGIAVDAAGNAYVTGYTMSSSAIATAGAHQASFGGGADDAFLLKFDAAGARQWGTYYGGSGADEAHAATVDLSGNIYFSGITGTSTGTSIATAGSHQAVFGGGSYDGFLAKFDGSGTRLWGTYYGGIATDESYGCATDPSGNVFMTGITYTATGTAIATAGSHQPSYGGSGLNDAFLVKFSSSGVRQWGTYYGGSGGESGYACACDISGNVFIGGYTASTNAIATAGCHQGAFGGGTTDGFLAKFDGNGVRQWGSYYGGTSDEHFDGCATDASMGVYFCGSTNSTNGTSIATSGAHQAANGGAYDAFIVKLNAGGVREWGTYYGGTGNEDGNGCAIDGSGAIYLAGNSSTATGTSIASSGSHQAVSGGGTNDGYLAKLTCNINLSVATSPASVCPGQSSTLTASGAYSYSWSTSATTAAITVTPAVTTTYTVTGSDLGGCTATTTRTITVNPLPNVTITGNAAICAGDAVTLTAGGAATYVWSNSSSGVSIIDSPVSATTYSVTGTDANGCSNTATHTVTVDALPNVTITGANAVCAGDAVTLTANGASSYTWSTSASGASITDAPAAATTYSVTGMSAGGCSNSASHTVTVNALPIVAITGPAAACSGDAVTLTANGANTYVWNTAANGATITETPALTTTYSVTGSDANGCSNSAMHTVNINPLPNVSVSGPAAVCSGGSVTLTANGADTYLWNTSAATASITETPPVTITYSVTGTDANGCVNTAAQTVTVNALPNVTITGANAVCAGDAVTLTANGAAGYLWNTSANTSSITESPAVTTTYSVSGTDGNGCSAGATQIVTVNALPAISISGAGQVCSGSGVTLTANGGSSYNWSTGATSTAITEFPATATTYTVTGTDTNGCSNTAQQLVFVNALPQVSYTEAQATVCINWSAITLTPGSPAGGTYSGPGVSGNSFDPSVSGAGMQTVSYTYTDTNGCSASAASAITVDLCTGMTGKDEAIFSVYPNPSAGQFTLGGLTAGEKTQVEVFDAAGRLIFSAETENETFPVSIAVPGVYLLRVQAGEKISCVRLVKE